MIYIAFTDDCNGCGTYKKLKHLKISYCSRLVSTDRITHLDIIYICWLYFVKILVTNFITKGHSKIYPQETESFL
jgi:hypothetical protein